MKWVVVRKPNSNSGESKTTEWDIIVIIIITIILHPEPD